MWLPKNQSEKKDGVNGLIAVAIDKEKGSQNALKWAVDNLLTRSATVILVHVKLQSPSLSQSPSIFTPRLGINVFGEESVAYVSRALIQYVAQAGIEHLILGSSTKTGLLKRFKVSDVPGTVAKGAPDFCTVYVISKGKIHSMRSASRPAPGINPVQVGQFSIRSDQSDSVVSLKEQERLSLDAPPRRSHDEIETFRSPFTRKGYNGRSYGETPKLDSDISFVSTGRTSSADLYHSIHSNPDTGMSTPPLSFSSEIDGNYSFDSIHHARRSTDINSPAEFASFSFDSERLSTSTSQAVDDMEAEMRRLKLELKQTMEMYNTACVDVRYRRYSIEEIEAATEFFSESLKIGEGGYGPVFKCFLDHTSVAVKVLRPDAAQGMAQFQREVEVLSCIRHPNMVLLVGACPEYGCLVYEYMANGSLDDRLFHRGNTPPLSWQLRFKIAAEIGTGLLFLHQTKPEPLVHRDLKPANILIDRNYVAKISDVGLARLVPPSVADSVTQYRMTSTAGTFCYIDPEYQQTGMLGVKSDIYSLGIIFLQILTARSPMGLAHHVEGAIEKGTFSEMLDPTVPDWPVEDALSLAKIAVQCAELRRKDRPDLAKIVLPELNRLKELAENSDQHSTLGHSISVSHERQVSVQLDENCPTFPHSGEIRRNTSVGV
ncbi:UspA [Sesbania bispinosa]|nr:UspA [Sesbania bispinosa]